MNIASLFLHNAVDESDRAEYGNGFTNEEIQQIEDSFDVLVDDPNFAYRHNKPRVPKKVDVGYNHFIIVKVNSYVGIKRFTWDNFKYLNSVEEVVKYIEYLHQPLSSRKKWEDYNEN